MARKKTPGASTGADPRRHRAATARSSPSGTCRATMRRLEAELAELQGQRADLEESTEASLADATGEVGFDEEFADTGGFTFERERDLSLVDSQGPDRQGRARPGRIDGGGFGRCQACGRPIEAERLDALPYATVPGRRPPAGPAALTWPSAAAAPRSHWVLALYGTAAAVLALDQLTKHLVVTNLAGRPRWRWSATASSATPPTPAGRSRC